MYEALYTQCFPSVCEKTPQATRAGFEPTTSCLLVQTKDNFTIFCQDLPVEKNDFSRYIFRGFFLPPGFISLGGYSLSMLN